MKRPMELTFVRGRAGRLAVALGLLAALVGAASALAKSSPPATSKAVCSAVPVGYSRCFSRVVTDKEGRPLVSSPGAVSGYGPVQFQTVYGLTAAAAASTTEVVAIVDAYDNPSAKSDLDAYSSNFGLPILPTCPGAPSAGCFKKVNQTGGSIPPGANAGWGLEIALDLDTVHAVCPKCGILLVEANNNGNANLYTAEDYAAAHATIVSNSWGGGEYSGETSDDSHFNHPGDAITVSSGDSGYGIEYPAASRYVTAVGGTTLNLNANNTRSSETVWSGAGSGCSRFETKQSWQTDSGCTRRTVADVSADADPNTGAAVYDTYGYGGWLQVGGTSLASPLIAGVYALAGVGGTSDYPSSYPYANVASLFDVVSGSNGFCGSYLCMGGVGYDGPSGLGTPIGTAAFASGGSPPPAPTVTSFSPMSGPVGTQVDVQGTSFTGASSVTFNGTPDTTFVFNSSTDITAHVPAGATTGPIAVTTPNGTGTSATNFTVTTGGGGAPTVTSFLPTSGPVGTHVTINGTNFTGVTSVQFNGVAATSYTVNSTVRITATVPTGATTGPISVSNGGGTGTSSGSFMVTTASGPRITSFSPTFGRTGGRVVITGANFTGTTSVELGGVSATFVVNSGGRITATVPSMSMGHYAWQVTTPGGTATSAKTFWHL
jgi:IPT/TIG domain